MADLRTIIRDRRCRHLSPLMVDYATGELPEPMRHQVEKHLARCVACAASVAALTELPRALRDTAPLRDDTFWREQRDSIMEAIGSGQTRPMHTRPAGFDWRLALPIAAALAIALAGVLSLRPPIAPGEIALDALPPEDVSVLIDVAGGILPSQELLPGIAARGNDVGGAVDAGWIGADDLPPPTGWGELDDGDLEALHAMLG